MLQAVEPSGALLSLLPLAPGARVAVAGLDPSATFVHGRVAAIDGEGMVRVVLVAGCGDVVVPLESVRRVCGECTDCRTFSYRPRCAWP